MRTACALFLLIAGFVCSGCTLAERIGGETALKAAHRMGDPIFPDERREGIYFLVKHDYGRHVPYTTRYKQIAQYDPDYTVRAAAVRALNISRDQSATGVFLAALNDKNDLVRIEAAKALTNIPTPNAADPLSHIVANTLENKDLRIAAADALRHYHNLGVARALVGVLNGREFGVSWQARHSLITITGKDLHYDETAWLNYLTSPGKPLG